MSPDTVVGMSTTTSPTSSSTSRWLGSTAWCALSLAALISLGVVACGGGSDSSTTPQPVAGSGSGTSTMPTPTPTTPTTPTPTTSPTVTVSGALSVTELATGLANPWGMAFLPDGRVLVTEKGGTLRLLSSVTSTSTITSTLISGAPVVNSAGQGGLLDVVLDPSFASNRRVYFTFAENDAMNASLNGTAVARAELDLASNQLTNLNVIYRQTPKISGSIGHYGARLVFDNAGNLFVAMGDRQIGGQIGFAQDLTRGNGKVVRITTSNGGTPSGNPAWTATGAQTAIWSYGHRNPQGAALHPVTGELWVSEHGPQGGDEINRVLAGKNYGWPIISYGQEYNTTTPVGIGTSTVGMEQPVSYWETRDGSAYTGGAKSSIAPSGLMFYTADKFPEYKNNLFSGALAGTALWRVVLGSNNQEIFRERLLANRAERIRDVRQGPDGWIYILTDGGNAKLLRVSKP
jgi:aldose sugar dehydrogenase